MVESPKPKSKASSASKVHYQEFAKRMELACDGNNLVPPINHGRLNWFVDQLKKQDLHYTIEAVRKWLAGDVRPRPEAMSALARILKVDVAWLANGTSPGLTQTEQKSHNRAVSGAVNLVAGLIQLDGSVAALPNMDDASATDNRVDLYAIIRGAKYNFHILVPVGTGSSQHFLVPVEARETIVLGVVPLGNFSFEVYELDWAGIDEVGSRKTHGMAVKIQDRAWRRISSFAERI